MRDYIVALIFVVYIWLNSDNFLIVHHLLYLRPCDAIMHLSHADLTLFNLQYALFQEFMVLLVKPLLIKFVNTSKRILTNYARVTATGLVESGG